MPTGPRLVEALVNDIVDRQQLAIDNRTNPIDKYQDALDAAGRPRLNIGSGTGQTFDVVRRLRNALVHYTPEWEHDFINGALYRDLTNRLKHRENRQPIGEPWFPNKALGAGCAEWAVDTSVAFGREWHTAMGLDAAEFDRMYVNWSEPPFDRSVAHHDGSTVLFLATGARGIPELTGVAVTVATHWWRRNAVLSIVLGTSACIVLANWILPG